MGIQMTDRKMQESPFKAYDGEDKYIFISYKHADSELVYPLIKAFHDAGFNIWYDDGLYYGTNYADFICDKIENASLFVIFFTETVINAATNPEEFMKYELNVALGEIPIFPIFLQDVKLRSTYRMYLSGKHSIFRHEFDSETSFIEECERGFFEDFKIPIRKDEPPEEFGDIKVIVSDYESNEPIQDAIIKVSDENNEYKGTTDSEGCCMICDVIVGEYSVETSHEKYSDGSNNISIVEGENELRINIIGIEDEPAGDVSGDEPGDVGSGDEPVDDDSGDVGSGEDESSDEPIDEPAADDSGDEPVDDEPASEKNKYNFDYLDELIHSGEDEIVLESDISWTDSDKTFIDGVILDVSDIVIDGNNHVIDAMGQARIFKVIGKNITLKNITFRHGKTDSGGAIDTLRPVVMTIENCSFESNESKGDGGAIRNWYSKLALKDCKFKNNIANDYGGAISNFGKLEMENCEFEGNSTKRYNGGAISSDDDLVIRDSVFTNNIARGNGDSLCNLRSGDLEVINSTFSDIEANSIYRGDFSKITVTDCSFEETPVDYNFEYLDELIHGGENSVNLTDDIVIYESEEEKYASGIQFDVDDFVFDGNGHVIDANKKGRHFIVTGNNVTFKNITFKNGNSRSGASFSIAQDVTCTFDSCTFINNTSADDGGCFNNYGNLKLISCEFKNNKALKRGGAIINWGELEIECSKFVSNTSEKFNGGSIYNEKDNKASITASKFSDNVANNGGAILNRGELTVSDCEFENNSSTNKGSSIHNRVGSIKVTHSIFSKVEDEEIHSSNGLVDVDDCLFKGDDVPDEVEDTAAEAGNVSAEEEVPDVEDVPDVEVPDVEDEEVPDEEASDEDVSKSDECEKPKVWNFKYLDSIVHMGNRNIILNSDIVYEEDKDSKFESGIKLNRNDLTIDGNGHTIDGSGKARIFDVCAKNITLKNFTFKNGYSKIGAVIETDRPVVMTIENCIFEDNHSYGDGGAIRNWYGKVNIKNCVFRNNSADDHGGAVFNYGLVKIMNCQFEGNEAKLHNGGALSSDNKLVVQNSSFKDNVSKGDGDSICNIRAGVLEVVKCKFDGKKFDSIFPSDPNNVIIKNCNFEMDDL